MDTEKPPRTRELSLCPCKSLQNYALCCGPYHKGSTQPQTAEQLMRSRYSAYFFRLIDYLEATTHPDEKSPTLRAEIQATADATRWKFLTVLRTSKGQPEDKTGKVEFIAQYYVNNEALEHHEVSRFRKYKGQWKYLDDKG
jgi:SEC-C motif domain protein